MICIQVYTTTRRPEPIDARAVRVVGDMVYVDHVWSHLASSETTVLHARDVDILTLVELPSVADEAPRMPL